MRLRSPILAAVCALLAAPAALAGAAEPLRLEVLHHRETGRIHHSSPTLVDVDGDGSNELVVGDLTGQVHAVRADGRQLFGFPARVMVDGHTVTAVESTPTVVDLDRDGRKEIVVGAGSTWVRKQQGGLVILDHRGRTRCRYRTIDLYDVWDDSVGARPDGFTEGVMSTAAVGDVDGNGTLDVVFGGWDNHLHAIDASCRPLRGFPFHHDDSIWSSPALHDVDADGRMEIFVGGASTPGGSEDWKGGVFRALDWERPGVLRERWKRRVGEVIDSSPAIGDADRDGRMEVYVGTGVFWGRGVDVPDSRRVFAWHLDDGSTVAGWPTYTGRGEVWASPSIGDLDGDGRDEVVVPSRDGTVRAHRADGTTLWRVRPNLKVEGGGEIVGSPVIADLDGDGGNDVAVGNGWGVFSLRGSDGTRLYQPVGKGHAFQNAPAVGRFGDRWVLVAAGMHMGEGIGSIWTHPIPAPKVRPPWPTWRRDERHTGATKPASG